MGSVCSGFGLFLFVVSVVCLWYKISFTLKISRPQLTGDPLLPTQLTGDRTQRRPTTTHAATNLQQAYEFYSVLFVHAYASIFKNRWRNPYAYCRKFGETLIKQTSYSRKIILEPSLMLIQRYIVEFDWINE